MFVNNMLAEQSVLTSQGYRYSRIFSVGLEMLCTNFLVPSCSSEEEAERMRAAVYLELGLDPAVCKRDAEGLLAFAAGKTEAELFASDVFALVKESPFKYSTQFGAGLLTLMDAVGVEPSEESINRWWTKLGLSNASARKCEHLYSDELDLFMTFVDVGPSDESIERWWTQLQLPNQPVPASTRTQPAVMQFFNFGKKEERPASAGGMSARDADFARRQEKLKARQNKAAQAPKGQVSVSFPQKGGKTVTAKQGEDLAKVINRAGLRVKFDCRNGRCGTCQVRLNGRAAVKICQGAKVPGGATRKLSVILDNP